MAIISSIFQKELARENEVINLIASEVPLNENLKRYLCSNIGQKYAEGYPGKRYYNGCKIIDQLEQACIENVAKVFKTKYANVQPHSGSTANNAVWKAAQRYLNNHYGTDLLTIPTLSMNLQSGGHLSHFSKPSYNESKIFPDFTRTFYGVKDDGSFDWDAIQSWLNLNTTGIIVIGCSSYPLKIDYTKFSELVRKASWGHYVICFDVSHVAGLICSGVFESPMDYDWKDNVCVMTSTTHKTWGGPRHAVICWNDENISKYINHAVFPELQGGANFAIIAAVGAWAEYILSHPMKYGTTQLNILNNLQELTRPLRDKLVFGKSENHLALIRCKSKKHAQAVADRLEESNIIVNTNSLYDGEYGLRVGTAYETFLGSERPWKQIGEYINYLIDVIKVDE